ncbi:alpha-2-macroglobulin family protein [Candidatus Uabimicrobium amorphum]|uniref:UPF0192 protein n=1 Tax=Uabimicrobium amorphum TaxID=2596890 RepID=A0A5S9IIR7_UABAM|nr:alpha-2-macroglobulin family protein [Candidatus Uabimicrobium amorphum]BBM82216.1 UPF0192 protein [Candidatus Uabimicrobium amorphum]
MKTFKITGILLGVVVLLLTIVAVLRPQGHRVTIVCNNTFIQGEQGNISICVTNLSNSIPVAGVKVRVDIDKAPQLFAEKMTSDQGFVNVLFDTTRVPCGIATLSVTATKNEETLHKSSFVIEVKSAQKLEIFTDKPIYQPGQTMHVRVLATEKLSGRPAPQQKIQLEVHDPKDNIICRKQLTASDFGIAWKAIAFAKQIIPGEYVIHASINEDSVTRKVQIQEYQLPRFTTDMDYTFRHNHSGYTIKGAFSVSHITGKKIASPSVKAQMTFMQEGIEKSKSLTLKKVDAKYHFTCDVWHRITSSKLIVEVADGSGHMEKITRKLHKSYGFGGYPITVYVVPESQHFDTEKLNTFFVYAFDRSGSPVQCNVYVACSDEGKQCRTNAFGLAEVQLRVDRPRYTQIFIEAWFDGQNNSAFLSKFVVGRPYYSGHSSKHNKFRLSTRVCQSGETIYAYFDNYNPRRGAYCIRLLHNNVALPTQIVGGKKVAIPIPEGLYGTLTLQSVFIDHESGENYLSEELVTVGQRQFLNIKTQLDQDEYRPGTTAKLSIQVENRKTKEPEQVAVSLNIIDRSVMEMFARIVANQTIALSPADQLLYNLQKCTDKELGNLAVRARQAFIKYERLHQEDQQEKTLQIIDDGVYEIWRSQKRQSDYTVMIIWCSIFIVFAYLVGLAIARSPKFVAFLITICVIGLLAAMLLPALSQVSEKAYQRKNPQNQINANIVPKHVRQHFPETLYFNPQIITDENGRVDVEIPIADSITTYNIETQAISAEGLRGKNDSELNVFQPFFIALNTPSSFMQNDEMQIGVAIYNHLKDEQKIIVGLQQQSWFEIVGKTQREVTVDKEGVAHFTLRVLQAGKHSLTAVAQLANKSFDDGVRRVITVVPDGKLTTKALNGKLQKNVSHRITVPEDAMQNQVLIKYYPKTTSVVVEGLESMLRTPHGCFEQTSSTSYPNVLILQYLRKIGFKKAQVRAHRLVGLGYQRVISFECSQGGFEWYGRNPGVLWLTAYGIQQLHATSKVHVVDANILERCYHFIEKQQKFDGSWKNPQLTAYITWSLCEAGMSQRKAVKKAFVYWQKQRAKVSDTYTMALLANAYAFANKQYECAEILKELMRRSQRKGKTMYWQGQSTLTRAYGRAANVETTALVAYAILHGKFKANLTPILDYLVKERDANGIWGSTHATILALKTLIASEVDRKPSFSEMALDIVVNGQKVGYWVASLENYDVVKQLDVSKWLKNGDNKIELRCSANSEALYQISQKYYAPWGKEKLRNIDFSLTYDNQNVKLGSSIVATASVKYRGKKNAESLMVELGIPSGFSVGNAVFEKLVKEQLIDHYELQENKVVLYVGELSSTSQLTFNYELRSEAPLKVKTPTSVAYEYYEPTIRAQVSSVQLTVTK